MLSQRSVQSNVCHQCCVKIILTYFRTATSAQWMVSLSRDYCGTQQLVNAHDQPEDGWLLCGSHAAFFSFLFFRWRLTRTEESRVLDDAKVFIDTSAKQIRKSPLIRDAIRRHTPHETWSVELYQGGGAGNDNDAWRNLKVIHLVYRHAPYASHLGGPRCNCVHSKKIRTIHRRVVNVSMTLLFNLNAL